MTTTVNNIFKNLQTSTSFASVSITEIMTAIQTGSLTFKGSSINTGALTASKEDKYSTDLYIGDKNKYNYLKVNSVMTWTPNASFNQRRHSSTVNKLTGLVYCDIDGVDAPATKEIVSKLPFVYAAWSSLSGTGIGFLVKADWTLDNFKQSYSSLSSYFKNVHSLELDKTSDITRTNVFSYDPNVYINTEASNIDPKLLSSFTNTNIKSYTKKASTAVKLTSTVEANLEELVENLDFEIDYASKVKIAIGFATKSMGTYTDGNKHNFRTSFIGTCTTIGIPFDIMMEEFEAYAESICEEVNYGAMEKLYNDFEGQGSPLTNMLNYNTNDLKVTQTITVDKYLDNQLPTEFTKNTILVAPTGSGKSTYVIEVLKGKRIVVCPNTAILKSFMSFKNVSVFYGDEKDTSFTDIILTTQDSFVNLVNVLEDKGQNLIDYLVIIDEFHTLVSSANLGYKYKAITSTIEMLSNYPVTVLGLTATPITTITNPFYHSFETILVKQKADVTREVQMCQYDDYRSFVIQKCTENSKSNTVTVVYKNDKRNIEVLAEALKAKGLTVAIINSDTKETVDYKHIVKKGDLVVDVILTTCLLKEGVSIKSKKESVSVDYIVTGETHYTEINQLSSRVRNASSIVISLASSVNSYKNYSLPFLFQSVVESIDSANNFLLPRVNATQHAEVEVKLDQKVIGSSIRYNEASQEFEADAIYKDYLIYEAETAVCSKNPLYTITRLLEDTRFDVLGSVLKFTEDNKKDITAAKETVADKEVEEKIDFKAIVEGSKQVSVFDKLQDIQDNGTKQEKSLCYYTKFVYARMKKQNLYAAIDKAYEFADSKRKFKDFNSQLELTELFTSNTGNSISATFFAEVKKSLRLKKQYTSEQIHEIFKAAAQKTEAKDYIKITKTKATQWFKLLGTSTEKTTKDKNRKSVRLYTLSSWGLAGFNYNPTYPATQIETVKPMLIKF